MAVETSAQVKFVSGEQGYIPNSRGEFVLTDVVDQHAAGDNNFRNDWMPDSSDYGGGRAEFVHLDFPGE